MFPKFKLSRSAPSLSYWLAFVQAFIFFVFVFIITTLRWITKRHRYLCAHSLDIHNQYVHETQKVLVKENRFYLYPGLTIKGLNKNKIQYRYRNFWRVSFSTTSKAMCLYICLSVRGFMTRLFCQQSCNLTWVIMPAKLGIKSLLFPIDHLSLLHSFHSVAFLLSYFTWPHY